MLLWAYQCLHENHDKQQDMASAKSYLEAASASGHKRAQERLLDLFPSSAEAESNPNHVMNQFKNPKNQATWRDAPKARAQELLRQAKASSSSSSSAQWKSTSSAAGLTGAKARAQRAVSRPPLQRRGLLDVVKGFKY